MKIGYPCINRSIGCTANSTFRLASYSESNLIEKIRNNLDCLRKILGYNTQRDMLFFRISSDIVPFAGHPICKFDWLSFFKSELCSIGQYIKEHQIRISMHPDQFVLINSPKEDIVRKSIAELDWQCRLLDSMLLDDSAKVQIHVGGVYDNKMESMQRFIDNYSNLPLHIKKRLVIENDEHLYSLKDCIDIHGSAGIPILLDVFHHKCYNNSETRKETVMMAQKTWTKKDGLLMMDYSSQQPEEKTGKHAEHIDIDDFTALVEETYGLDFDIMLEIKDKEKSALEAVKLLKTKKLDNVPKFVENL